MSVKSDTKSNIYIFFFSEPTFYFILLQRAWLTIYVQGQGARVFPKSEYYFVCASYCLKIIVHNILCRPGAYIFEKTFTNENVLRELFELQCLISVLLFIIYNTVGIIVYMRIMLIYYK